MSDGTKTPVFPGDVGPRKRGRPPTIDDEQLLAVAREVFLERGIRATSQEVAARAGVSEGSLFHRFKSKEALFRQAMKFDREDVAQLFDEAMLAVEPLPLREALEQLANRMLAIGRIAIPLMMMSWSNPSFCADDHAKGRRSPYRILILRLSDYVQAKMAEGTLRKLEPEVVARTYLGALHHYSMVRILSTGDPDAMPQISEERFVAELIELLLMGAAPLRTPPEPTTRS